MGFSGLSHWNESDGAADFRAVIARALNKAFKKELKNEANCYNTPGWVNALLLFKEYPSIVPLIDKDVLNYIDDRIEQDVEFSNDKKLAIDFIPLVVNFRQARLKNKKSLFDEE